MTDHSGKSPDRHAPELASIGVEHPHLDHPHPDRAPPDWAEFARPHVDMGHQEAPRFDEPRFEAPAFDRPMPMPMRPATGRPHPDGQMRDGAREEAGSALHGEAHRGAVNATTTAPSATSASGPTVAASVPVAGHHPASQATPRRDDRRPAFERVNRDGTSDVALSAAFAMLSLTVGAVLHLVVELPLLVSALLTVSCLSGLLAAQLFARRTTTVATLQAEIADLKDELARLKGRGSGMPASAAGSGLPESKRLSGPATVAKSARDWLRRPSRRQPDDLATAIAGVREATLASAAGVEATSAPIQMLPRDGAGVRVESVTVAEVGVAAATGAVGDPRVVYGTETAGTRTPDARPMAAQDPHGVPVPAAPMRGPVLGHQPSHDEPGMAPYWALRPGTHREPRVTVAAADAAALASGPLPLIDATSKGHFGHAASASRFESPARPVRHAGSLADLPTAGTSLDLDTMQNLIEQLAVQLHHPADDGPATPASAAGPAMPSPAASSIATASAAVGAGAEAIRVQAGLSAAADVLGGTAAPIAPSAPAPGVTEEPAQPRQLLHEAAPFGHLALIAEAVEANRMDVCLDPILGLADRKARHFELSVRLVTARGDDMDEDVYADIAAGTGLLARIDAEKLSRAANVLERLRARGSRASLFSSIAGESLADDNFAGTFADILTAEEGLGARLVLTFAQAEARNFTEAHWRVIADMSSIGLRFSLADVVDLDMDFAALKGRGFDFIKLDAAVFLDGLPTPGGHIPAADICRHLAEQGLGVIVGGIVAEKDLAKVLGFGALLGQGTLFGGPRSVELERERRAA